MTARAINEVNWPRLSTAQRACADEVLAHLGVGVSLGTPSVRVVSARAGYVILLTLNAGDRKIIKISLEGEPTEVETEYSVMTTLGGDYANRLSAFAYGNRTAALALRWVEAASLSSRWAGGRVGENVRQRSEDLRSAGVELERIHQSGMIHGDIQPTHIRFLASSATFIDFGVAGAQDADFGGGLIHYLAPEYASRLLRGCRPRRTAAADWYALIASAFTAVTGTAPVNYRKGANRQSKLKAIAAQQIHQDGWSDPFARDLAKALTLSPMQRRDWVMQ